MKGGDWRVVLFVALIWLALFWIWRPAKAANLPDALDLTVIVKHEATYDSAGLEFFTLVTPRKGRFLISADANLPIAIWLKERDGERVSVSLNGR